MKSLTQVHPRWRGNPALRDAVGKISGKEGLRFEGKAIVFEGEENELQAILKGTVKKGHVVVIRSEGPESLLENFERRCFRAKDCMARRDEGEYPLWIFDRGATKPGGLLRENPPGGGSFVRGRRWLARSGDGCGFEVVTGRKLFY